MSQTSELKKKSQHSVRKTQACKKKVTKTHKLVKKMINVKKSDKMAQTSEKGDNLVRKKKVTKNEN